MHTLVIDEISMVSSQTLVYIHRRLAAIKGNDNFFGGLNVILIGDFHQLKPVRGTFAFQNNVIWNLFDSYILETNMRQTGTDGYSQLLNRIRVGTFTEEDIGILTTRLLIQKNYPQFEGVLRVYPTLKEVQEYNLQRQYELTENTVQIDAVNEFSSSDIGQDDDINNFIPADDRDAGGLPNILLLSIGTRVMLIRNIATDYGLINGALGFVHHIEFAESKAFRLFIRFDDESIGRIFQDATHNAISIDKISQEFYYRGRSMIRTQFPLLPAWAATIH